MRIKYLILIITALCLSCSNNDITSIASLDGKWVEQTLRKDTIDFSPDFEGKYFVFKSDDEIAGYNSLYSTFYEYRIEGNQISLYNLISSCYCFSDYYFKRSGDAIKIENFYDPNSKGNIETFVKLK